MAKRVKINRWWNFPYIQYSIFWKIAQLLQRFVLKNIRSIPWDFNKSTLYWTVLPALHRNRIMKNKRAVIDCQMCTPCNTIQTWIVWLQETEPRGNLYCCNRTVVSPIPLKCPSDNADEKFLAVSYSPSVHPCMGHNVFKSHFYAPRSNDQGHIVFVPSACLPVCLSVVNCNIRYNFWTVRDRGFIFAMLTQLMIPFRLTPRSMTFWHWLWP